MEPELPTIGAPLFDPVGGYWTVAGAGAVLLLLLFLGPGRDRTTYRRRTILVVLRLLVIALVLLAMLRPSLMVPRIDDRPDTVLLLVDRSRSMQTADLEGGRTRWQAVEELLAGVPDVMAEYEKDLTLQVYGFDVGASRQEPTDGAFAFVSPPDGDETALGTSLEQVLRPEAGKRLAGVFLVTDGAQRTLAPNPQLPEIPVKHWLADRGFPLFTIALGKERASGQARDIELRNLLTSEPVFIKNPLVVEGTAHVEGFENQQIEVQLLVETAPGSGEMQPAAAVRIDGGTAAGELGRSISLEHIPTKAGEFRVALRSPPQPGELKTTNNEVITFVTVFGEGLNVLYIEGGPRVEQTFLRRSLEASPDIQVDYLEIDATKPNTRPADLLERFKPGAYDVYLFGDIDSSAFTADEMTALVGAINKGAGFAMLGGIHSFGAGGYGTSPLAAVLPIRIDRLERQNFGEAIRADLHLDGKFQLVPTRIGGAQPLMQLAAGDAANAAVWRALPPIIGANRFAGVTEGSLTLAAADGPDGAPLVVSRDYGAGRVVACAVDSTWRWRMRGYDAEHKRFWRRTILWLAHREDQAGDGVWLRLPQRTFSPGAELSFTMGAQTPDRTPIEGAVFTPVVTAPDGQKFKPAVRRRGDETFGELTLPPGPAGDYLLEVTAEDSAKKPLGRAQARFHIFGQDLELDNPNAYPGLLRGLAEMTPGGRAITIAEFADVVKQLRDASQEKRTETPELQSLWDRWELLIAFVTLLAIEWFLRKKWGLV